MLLEAPLNQVYRKKNHVCICLSNLIIFELAVICEGTISQTGYLEKKKSFCLGSRFFFFFFKINLGLFVVFPTVFIRQYVYL